MSFSDQINYYATITALTASESKHKQTPQMAVTMQVTHEQQGGEWVALAKPAERTMFWYMSEGAWPYTQKKLAAIGFNGNFDAPDCTERGIEVCMSWETYDGKDRERWELARAGGELELAPLPKDKARRFAAMWKQAGGPVPASKPKAPVSAPPPVAPKPVPVGAPEPLPGDEVPF